MPEKPPSTNAPDAEVYFIDRAPTWQEVMAGGPPWVVSHAHVVETLNPGTPIRLRRDYGSTQDTHPSRVFSSKSACADEIRRHLNDLKNQVINDLAKKIFK